MIWFLLRLNHSGDDSPRTNARNNDAVSSEPNDAQRASALLKDLEDSEKPINTTCVEVNDQNEKEQEEDDNTQEPRCGLPRRPTHKTAQPRCQRRGA